MLARVTYLCVISAAAEELDGKAIAQYVGKQTTDAHSAAKSPANMGIAVRRHWTPVRICKQTIAISAESLAPNFKVPAN